MAELHTLTPQRAKKADDICNIEAEQMVIGTLLLDNAALGPIAHILQADHFFDPVHRRIFEAISGLIRDQKLASPVTLAGLFAQDTGLDELGGKRYFVNLASVAQASGVKDYALVLVDAYQRRTLIDAMASADAIIRAGKSIADAHAEIEQATAAIAMSDVAPPTTSIYAAAVKAVDRARDAYQGIERGVKTGIHALDDMTGGLQRGDLVVIPAAPSMGKTALALGMATAYAKNGFGVGFVSLEMGDIPLADRVLSDLTQIPYRDIARGNFRQEDGVRLAKAAKDLESWPLQIVQSHIRTAEGIYSAARRIEKAWAARGQTLDCLFVDYLQLIEGRGNSRAEIVTGASVALKAIAMRMNIPVIALAQINNKAMADRDDKVPRLTDIRESGQIEQDASLILMVHREEYYLVRNGPKKGPDGKPAAGALADFQIAMDEHKNKMTVVLAKNRHGSVGKAVIGCNMSTNSIFDMPQGGDND